MGPERDLNQLLRDLSFVDRRPVQRQRNPSVRAPTNSETDLLAAIEKHFNVIAPVVAYPEGDARRAMNKRQLCKTAIMLLRTYFAAAGYLEDKGGHWEAAFLISKSDKPQHEPAVAAAPSQSSASQ